jgi:hypothetical protein
MKTFLPRRHGGHGEKQKQKQVFGFSPWLKIVLSLIPPGSAGVSPALL